MKLELKHLAPYLPYGLNIENPKDYRFDGMSTDAKTLKLDGIQGEFIKFDNISCFYPIQAFKPILRPLSDLTKRIAIGDDSFIPIYRILRTCDLEKHNIEWDISKRGIIEIWAETKCCERTISESLTLGDYLKLFEWHFDVFGLIENNLAIDINTI
jgi:hypothetical protein